MCYRLVPYPLVNRESENMSVQIGPWQVMEFSGYMLRSETAGSYVVKILVYWRISKLISLIFALSPAMNKGSSSSILLGIL